MVMSVFEKWTEKGETATAAVYESCDEICVILFRKESQ